MVLDCKEQPFGVALWGARLLARAGLLLAFLWGQPVAGATPAMELYAQYKREANEADTPEARARVYKFWEKQFDDFLSRGAPNDRDRLTLMAERGALLRELGRHEEAIGAWLALDQTAADLGNLRFRIEALDTAWSDVRRVPKFEEKVLVAIERCLDDMLNASTMPPPQSMSRVAQVCEEVSRTYWTNASIQAGQQEKRQMLERAEVWGKKSLALLPAGDNRIPNVRFLLGRLQVELGKGLEAADQFEEMLESGQSRFATTWVAHWRLKALVPVDTAEYVDGIQEILRKYEEDDYLLTLKQELARSLFVQERYAEAAEVFEWLIGRDPSDGPNATNMFLLAGAYESVSYTHLTLPTN